jgi:trimethylamine--corrinoid protein Co-methyltransferase
MIIPKSRLELLTKNEKYAIHCASLDVLANTGIKIESEKALKILEEFGVLVDYKTKIAKFPPSLVEECIKKAPKLIRLCARDPRKDVVLDKRHVHFSTDGCGVETIDFNSGKRRRSVKDDVEKSAMIANSLDVVSIYWPMVSAQDTPKDTRFLHELHAALRGTVKHVQHIATSSWEAQKQIEIAELILGERGGLKRKPIISAYLCTVPPLHFDKGATEAAMEFAKASVPVAFMSMPLAGANAPATLAGCLVIMNSEVLGYNTLVQCVNPGAPVIYCNSGGILDMRTSAYVGGAPESGLINAAGGELAHYYGFPCIVGGMGTESSIPGQQAAYEKMQDAVLHCLVGVDIIDGIGLLDSCKLLSFEQMVIDAEMAEMALRIAKGIEVNDDTLAVDVIHKVGCGGHFLAEKHTRDYWRKEHWLPTISVRSIRGKEEMDIWDVAKKKVKEILASECIKLDKDVDRMIEEFIRKSVKGYE